MPSTTSSSVCRPLASSTVITPSLPTFCIASAIISPMLASPFAEMVPTCAISAPVNGLGASLQLLDHRRDGGLDAALEVHRVHARGDRLVALLDDRLGQHGRGGGAVAGLVRGLGRDLAQHLRAHVLELVEELNLLGDGHAVLGDARRAERFLHDDVAALGAQRHLDRVGQHIDAPKHTMPGIGIELDLLGSHGRQASVNLLCFLLAIGWLTPPELLQTRRPAR